ncbi:MAG: ABC transporter permease, partial [Pseudonocardia sp.]|nr:ABC transporter permease [Pseudonocardia sp.]
MNTWEALVVALRCLRVNKLRSLLTMVGIVIGVTAVIVLVGLGDGMRAGFNKSFGELATAIIISKITGEVPGGGKPKELRDSDITALRKAPDLAYVVPEVSGTAVMQNGPGVEFSGQGYGSTVDYSKVNNREVVAGSMFTETDYQIRNRVTLLGPTVVTALFGGDVQAAVGTNIRISRTTFKVIGVLKGDGNYDDIALMPMSTARAYLFGGNDVVNAIAAKATSVETVPAAVDEINAILSERHRTSDPAKRDFKVTALQNQLDQFNQFMLYLSLFIVAVAGISLIVGGIGVANIMLVSVTERTREIGIRKAIGAPKAAIMKQFLIESTILAGTGGLIGV